VSRLRADSAIEALRAGDEAAFASLVAEHGPAMLRVARAFAADRAGAEELVREAWIGALGALDGFDGRRPLRAWLLGILVEQATARAAPAPAGADEPAVDPSLFNGPGDRWHRYWTTSPVEFDALSSRATVAVAERAIAELPGAQRAVLCLRDAEGWGADEVCDALALAPAEQRALLHRARCAVRRALERHVASGRAAAGA
jgi:RNA polymerase sigma-70 factor, ECF subfamily